MLTITGSPHIHSKKSVPSIMWNVVIALLPTLFVSIYYFGIGSFLCSAVAVLSCVAIEYFLTKYLLKKPSTIADGSAVVTGLLLAFNVPSNLPLWQIIIGSLVAIGVAKISFGGLGTNPFNPALIGRVFLLISFPVDMTSYPVPVTNRLAFSDAITGPTSLTLVKEGLKAGKSMDTLMNEIPSYAQLLFGNRGGSLGEIATIAIVLGGLYLLFRKIITWHIPFSFIATVFAFTGILWLVNPNLYISPFFHVLTGGLLLSAIFMATDYVTSPVTWQGMIIFGIGCGIITVIIRVWGSYPEGVSFAILVMNAFTPLINNAFKQKVFGEKIKK